MRAVDAHRRHGKLLRDTYGTEEVSENHDTIRFDPIRYDPQAFARSTKH